MKRHLFCVAMITCLTAWGCSATPETEMGKDELHNDAGASLKDFESEDMSLQGFLNDGYGYAIFPSVGKGAAGVGGSWGRGEVYEKGVLVGYCDITQWTLGVSLGGQTLSELIVFHDKFTMDQFEDGDYAFSAQASAVAIQTGAAASDKYDNGVAVFVMSRGGLMVDASIGGQKFSFDPLQ